ncbi:MAG: hypothetical protein M3347_10540 [Armatimonadota bacterium]|nr:hypothetical protein [Armatimonadota bacterium]
MSVEAPNVVETRRDAPPATGFDQEFVQMVSDVAAGWVRELEGEKVEEVADRIRKLLATVMMSDPLDVEAEILNITCQQCRDNYYTCRLTKPYSVCKAEYDNCMLICT